MIIRRHRFHGYGSLKPVYLRGQSVRGDSLSLRYSVRSSGKPFRVAVVVSKKVNKSAVVRNRIRRRVYEIIRKHMNDVPEFSDLVFTAFDDGLAKLENDRLEAIVTGLLNKIKRL